MNRLKGKVAIITGAGAGIGRASMERFAEEGALVVGIGRTYEKLEQAKAQLQDKGLKCHIVGGDVSIWEGASEASTQRSRCMDALMSCSTVQALATAGRKSARAPCPT
jgi:NADP-dependent 3-hydroxy acid dehydrogenase YdfG